MSPLPPRCHFVSSQQAYTIRTAVISPMPTRRRAVAFDPTAYKARNIIERAFNRLKDWRAIATRYDKKASNFLAGVCLAAAVTYWMH